MSEPRLTLLKPMRGPQKRRRLQPPLSSTWTHSGPPNDTAVQRRTEEGAKRPTCECSSVVGRSRRWTGDHRTTAGCGHGTWNPAVSERVRRRSRQSSRPRTPPMRPSAPRSADHAAGASDRDCDGDGGDDVASKIGSRVPRRTRTTLPTARLHRRSLSMVVPCGLPLDELGK